MWTCQKKRVLATRSTQHFLAFRGEPKPLTDKPSFRRLLILAPFSQCFPRVITRSSMDAAEPVKPTPCCTSQSRLRNRAPSPFTWTSDTSDLQVDSMATRLFRFRNAQLGFF